MADPLDGELVAGEFRRQQSRSREWVGAETGFAVQDGRYHL